MSGRGNDRTDPEDYGDVNDSRMILRPEKLLKKAAEMAPDMVKHPAHYTKWVIQPRDFAQANDLTFWQGSVIKYILRAGDKLYDGMTIKESELLDLRKAQEFIESRIKYVQGDD